MQVPGAGLPRVPIRVPSETNVGTSPANPGQGVKGFVQTLSDAIQEVNRLQLQAGSTTEQSIRGHGPSLNRVMVESEEAGIAFQMSLQFRNKALEAYQEVMRMQF